KRELRPSGLGQKRINVCLCHRVRRVVCLGLDSPEGTAGIFGDEVNPGVRTPASWPLVPEPHASQLAVIDRVVGEEPSADGLKLSSTLVGVDIQGCEQVTKTSHGWAR